MSLKLKACCLCLPLRNGLLIWGYCGLVLIYINILQVLYRISDILEGSEHLDTNNLTFTKLSLVFGAFLIHFIFYIILVAGLHRRSHGLLSIFYDYTVIIFIITATIMALYIPLRAYKTHPQYSFDEWWLELLINVGTAVATLLLQFYLIILVRSFLSTLEEEKDCSSPVHQTDDQECILHMYNPNKDCYDSC